MSIPDFVVIGHVVQDLIPGGWRLGGTVTFAAVQAQRLGLSAGIVTRAAPDLALDRLLPGVAVAGRPSSDTTAFENVYDSGRRRQTVPRQAEPVAPDDVPPGWRRAPIALIGPVCGETPPDMPSLFPDALVGVAAQGWLRTLDRNRHVRRRAWSGQPFWRGAHALFVSDEDLGRRRDQLDIWSRDVPIVALTRYRRGATIIERGVARSMPAFPTDERDPTGAGDVFAAAFLIHYYESERVDEAARFAAAAAACSVEGESFDAIASRDAIEARMAQHPEVALR